MEEANEINPQISESMNHELNNSSNYDIPARNKNSELTSEINSLYTGVGLRDISNLGFFELRGNDVLDFLHRISTNSIKNIVKGEIAKTIFTTEKGRIIDTAVVLNLEDYQILIGSREHHEKMMIWLNKYIISDDVKLNNINGKFTLLELLGPQTDSFMTLISGSIVNSLQPNSIKIINTEGIIFFLIKHYDYNGQLIYWILADPVYAQKLIRYMVENKGPFDFNFIGDEAYWHYRIEQGIPIAPSEINDDHNPHELGLMNLVSGEKGCYIGQEIIARLETYDKVQNYFCGFVFYENPIEHESILLFDEAGSEAGIITSSIFSNRFGKQLGLGFVKRKYFEEGKILAGKDKNSNSFKVIVKKLPFKK